MKQIILILIIYLLLLTGGCATTTEQSLQEQGLKPLSAEQLRQLMPGNTAVGNNTRGSSFVVEYRVDGTQGASAIRSGNRLSDTGVWEITEDGQWCSQWRTWRNGQRACFKLYQVAEKIMYFTLDGAYEGSFQLEPGHSRGL